MITNNTETFQSDLIVDHSDVEQDYQYQPEPETVEAGLFYSDRELFKTQLIAGLMAIPDNYSLVAIRVEHGKPTKAPKGNAWQKTEFSRNTIANQIRSGEASGFGIKLGEPSGGIVALDIDGVMAEKALKAVLGGDSLPKTVSMTSGKLGCAQYLFKVPTDKQAGLSPKKETHVNTAAAKGEDLDFRWNGNQSVLPPSAHPETAGYIWVDGCSPDETEIAEIPVKLLAHWLLLLNPAKGAKVAKPQGKTAHNLPSKKNKGDFDRILAAGVAKVANCLEGGRNQALNDAAITLMGLSPDKEGLIRSELTEAAIACGLDLKAIEATLNSAFKAGIEKPIVAYGSSESGKPQPRLYAQMLQTTAMKYVEYCTVTDTFMAYSDKNGLWEQVADKKGEAMVNRALSELGVFSLRFTMDVWAFIKLDAIAKESSFLPLGKDKIAFQNGVLDLKTMILTPNSPDLKVTTRLEYCYPDVGSDFPITRQFISDIACGDEELQGFFFHWLAATLRRMSGCRKFLNLYGHTTNGKSTYLKLIATMIGQGNVFSTSLSKLGGHFGASGADGKWAIQCTDDRGGYGIDYGNLLKFSGDDNNVPMVKKGKDQKGVVNFQGLVMLATNINLFAGQIGDAAIKTRMISVHCQASFTEDQQDEHLLEKMTAELPQLVHHLLNINPTEVAYGLRHSGDISVIKAHNLEQILDGEMVADFWDKVCIASTGETLKTPGLLVYNAYCHYYSELHNGTKPNLSAKKFYPALVRYALALSDITLTKDLENKRALVYTNLSLVDFSHLGMNSMVRG